MDIPTSMAGRLAALAAATFALALPGMAHATTFTVDAASDEADAALDGVCDTGSGHCTLRAAIQEANNLSGPDAIHFSIGITAPVKITPASKLPALTSPVTIDGLTQPGAYSLRPGVELDATNETGGDGLEFSAGSGGSVVKGLIVNHAPGYGLRLAAQTAVMATWVGIDSSGLVAAGNASGGILVTTGGAGSLVGVPDQLRNVISANGGPGVEVDAGPVSIQNNYVGTNYVGWTPLGNAGAGVAIADGATGDTIGGTGSNEGNLITANQGTGISVDGSAAPVIGGNIIGLNASGEFSMGNGADGISLKDAPNAVIGVEGSTGRNVIAGSTGDGIAIGSGSANAAINGNYIGLRPDGTGAVAGNPLALGNSGDGISVASSDVSIGETTRNVIAGNSGAGVRIAAGGATIVNNLIGTDATKSVALGNGGHGILIDGVSGSRIGAPDHGNLIAGSGGSAIYLDAASAVVIQGNGIGLDGNGFAGANGGTSNAAAITLHDGASNTTIGGTGTGEGNIISAQLGTGDGIELSGTPGSGNRIRGNSIGFDGGLGIDLGGNDVTANDPGDADSGWNGLQNFPVITDASHSLGAVRVSGRLDTTPGAATYALDFFVSTECDASGNGEGSQYLGTRSVQTDSGGHAFFDFELPGNGSALTSVVTATATSPSGDTSEFSHCSASPYSGVLDLRPPTMQVREPGGSVAFDVVRQYGIADTISVDYATADDTATAPADYTATSGTLVFGPGETTKQIVIPINDDKLFEGDETFTVTLSNPVFTAIPSNRRSVVTILENDPFRPDAQAVAGVKIGSKAATKKAAAKKCKVPKLRGLTRKKATAKLKKAGCKVGKVRKSKKKVRNKKLRKKVVAQKPKAGKKVKRGTKVALTLGR